MGLGWCVEKLGRMGELMIEFKWLDVKAVGNDVVAKEAGETLGNRTRTRAKVSSKEDSYKPLHVLLRQRISVKSSLK